MTKLVRDKIPDIMRAKNQNPVTRIAEHDDEYFDFLRMKLLEEVNEFIESCKSTIKTDAEEELADILEVIDAICSLKKYNIASVQNIKTNKGLKNGSFNKRVILISTTHD